MEAWRFQKQITYFGYEDGNFVLNRLSLSFHMSQINQFCKKDLAMKKTVVLLLMFFVIAKMGNAQKIDSIYFHLYTDSLKKGYYNYINVDGKTADGNWIPLSASEVIFTTNKDSSLKFQNNELFIDSAYTRDTVTIRAVLKDNPSISKEVTIYIRKRGFDEPLKSNDELLNEIQNNSKKIKKKNLTSS